VAPSAFRDELANKDTDSFFKDLTSSSYRQTGRQPSSNCHRRLESRFMYVIRCYPLASRIDRRTL